MWRDDAYCLIAVGARKVLKYSQGVDFERFDRDEVLQDAIMRRIQIIGEARESF